MSNYSFNIPISVGTDDAYQAVLGGTIQNSATTVSQNPGTLDDTHGYYRFQLPYLHQGATINSATLTLVTTDSWDDSYSPLIRVEDVDDSAAFDTATPEVLHSRSWQTGTTWNTTSWSAGATKVTVDFSAQVQTVVDRAGWAGGSLTVLIDITSAGSKDDDFRFAAFENATYDPALLTITATQGDVLSEWDGYDTITVDSSQVDEAIHYCPIYLSKMSADWWTALDNYSDTTGATIRVASADGSTQIAQYVLDTIDTVLQEGVLFIDSNSISTSVDTDFRVYAGHPHAEFPAATDSYGRDAVFEDHVAVYSLTGAAALTDLTGNGYNLTALNSPTAAASTPYEGVEAYTLASASSQSLEANNALPSLGWPMTIEGFCYQTSVANQIAFGATDTVGDQYTRLEVAPYDAWNVFQGYARGVKYSSSSAASISGTAQTTWYYSAASRDGTTGTTTIFRDGTTATNTTTILSAAFDSVNIGCQFNISRSQYFDGSVSWVAVKQATRSLNALNTQYAAWNDASFITNGGWTDNTPPSGAKPPSYIGGGFW